MFFTILILTGGLLAAVSLAAAFVGVNDDGEDIDRAQIPTSVGVVVHGEIHAYEMPRCEALRLLQSLEQWGTESAPIPTQGPMRTYRGKLEAPRTPWRRVNLTMAPADAEYQLAG